MKSCINILEQKRQFIWPPDQNWQVSIKEKKVEEVKAFGIFIYGGVIPGPTFHGVLLAQDDEAYDKLFNRLVKENGMLSIVRRCYNTQERRPEVEVVTGPGIGIYYIREADMLIV